MNSNDHAKELAVTASTEKAVQLFTYLRELCALRTSQVRDVSQYDEVFWFGDIPHERLCHCIAWRIGQNSDDPGEERSDFWLEVHKPELSDAGSEYPKKGKYTACVKVVDTFGCDTSISVIVDV